MVPDEGIILNRQSLLFSVSLRDMILLSQTFCTIDGFKRLSCCCLLPVFLSIALGYASGVSLWETGAIHSDRNSGIVPIHNKKSRNIPTPENVLVDLLYSFDVEDGSAQCECPESYLIMSTFRD